MEKETTEELSYVLFGDDAIKIYKMSLKLLLSSNHIKYKVNSFDEVKSFMQEAANWDNYIEISKGEYLQLINNQLRPDLVKRSKKKGIFKFFK